VFLCMHTHLFVHAFCAQEHAFVCSAHKFKAPARWPWPWLCSKHTAHGSPACPLSHGCSSRGSTLQEANAHAVCIQQAHWPKFGPSHPSLSHIKDLPYIYSLVEVEAGSMAWQFASVATNA
jgi:hypothetical protein